MNLIWRLIYVLGVLAISGGTAFLIGAVVGWLVGISPEVLGGLLAIGVYLGIGLGFVMDTD